MNGGTSRSFAVHTLAAVSQFAWMMVPEIAARLSFIYFSNSQRSGKSLLAQIPIALIHGVPAQSSYKKDDDKMASTLDVIVRNRSQYAFFDNLKGHLSSDELEAFMTGMARKVRLFHTQQEKVFPNRATCFLTGNSLTWSTDIGGRCLVCDLFVEEADAQERQVEVVRSVGSFLDPGLL